MDEILVSQISDGLNDSEKTSFVDCIALIKKGTDITDFGKYHLDLLGKTFVDKFTTDHITETDNPSDSIKSSKLYNYFIGWLKENHIHQSIVNYFSCVTFVKYFGEGHTQKRYSSGKVWENIVPFKESRSFALYNIVCCDKYDNPENFKKIHAFRKTLKHVNHGKTYVTHRLMQNKEKLLFFATVKSDKSSNLLHPIRLSITCSPEQLNTLQNLSIYRDDNDTCVSSICITMLKLTKLLYQKKDTYCFDISHLPNLKNNYNQWSLKLFYGNTKVDVSDVTVDWIHELFTLEPSDFRKMCLDEFIEMGIVQDKKSFVNNALKKCFKMNINSFCRDVVSKGFYVIDDNIDNIDSVTLELNTYAVRKYDSLMLQSICQKLNNNVLYIPLCWEKKHDDPSIKSFFNNVMLHSRLETVNMIIDYVTKPEHQTVTICVNGGHVFSLPPNPAT
jgi:hypothetical protein